MGDIKSEISRISDVKCRAFLTSKDDFLVAAKNGTFVVSVCIGRQLGLTSSKELDSCVGGRVSTDCAPTIDIYYYYY